MTDNDDFCPLPGLPTPSPATRALALEAARRAARRDHQPLPAGGLFDEVARAQQDMFG